MSSAPAHRGSLPIYVEPFRLCDGNARVQGHLPATRLQRISECADTTGAGTTSGAEVDLLFRRDDEGRNRIAGTVDMVVGRTCSRCLEPLDVPVHVQVDLLVLAAGTPVPESAEDLDIVEVVDGRLALVDLVEEEVLLALPQFPAHESCDMVAYAREAGDRHAGAPDPESVAARQAEQINPFDVLAALKQKD